MSKAAKELFAELAGPGPHEVLRGDLGAAGVPGVVFTPREGLRLPAVVFGRGWLQPANRYRGLLRHLASWGIVAVAPNTTNGSLVANQRQADELRTVLDICVGVRLGDGRLSVDLAKLGLAGHSTGGGAAVLAAAEDWRTRAVATVAAAETRPSAVAAAGRISVPGLHLAAGKDLIAPAAGHAEAIARAWRGPVCLRELPAATHLGVTEGQHWSELLLDGKPERATQRITRSLLTAFFLVHLTGAARYRPLLTEDIRHCEIAYQHIGTMTRAS